MKLTNRQQETLTFVKEYILLNGYPPTRQEIGTRFGITASSAHQRLWNMERKGVVSLLSTARGIRVL